MKKEGMDVDSIDFVCGFVTGLLAGVFIWCADDDMIGPSHKDRNNF